MYTLFINSFIRYVNQPNVTAIGADCLTRVINHFRSTQITYWKYIDWFFSTIFLSVLKCECFRFQRTRRFTRENVTDIDGLRYTRKRNLKRSLHYELPWLFNYRKILSTIFVISSIRWHNVETRSTEDGCKIENCTFTTDITSREKQFSTRVRIKKSFVTNIKSNKWNYFK